ncbi:hypothetical protein ASPCAL14583 [Aspergillus calidoustus]|uniref:Uncharacterized protein n=1 Tax=Aspergillus calidoustus TaxID=454130 RepID=A0A0U5CK57_ASPCI|nr:hypothetical protein ASPCAL14583 [Aspergillus calidoustus]
MNTDAIPILHSKNQWYDWHNKVCLELRKAGYGHLLRRKRTKSVNAPPNAAATALADNMETLAEATEDSQARLRRRTNLKPGTESRIKLPHRSLVALDGPSDTATGMKLECMFFSTSLKNTYSPTTSSVQDLRQELDDIIRQLGRAQVQLPTELAIAAFAQALRPEFAPAKAVYFNTSAIKHRTSDPSQSPRWTGLTLAAKSEEPYHRRLDEDYLGLLADRPAPRPTGQDTVLKVLAVHGDTANIQVKWCTHCNKAFHDKETCHALHPEMRDKWLEKRKRRRANTRVL